MTLISRVLGFIRDQVFAIVLGAGPLTDAFFVAFKIPNFLRRLFAEGAFAQSFVPVFTEYKETRSRADLAALAARVSGTLGLILILLSILGSLFAPTLVSIFAPGFEPDDERRVLTAQMLRITFPYLFFISLVAYAGGVLNSFQRFCGTRFYPGIFKHLPDHRGAMGHSVLPCTCDSDCLGRIRCRFIAAFISTSFTT